MKTLELGLNRKLLIVELPDDQEAYYKEDLIYKIDEEQSKYSLLPKGEFKFICKGSEFTEDIARGFTHSMNFGTDENPDIGYHHSVKDNYWCESALESFIMAIQAKNYHWGENPEGDQPHNTGLLNLYPTGHALMDVSLDEAKKWIDAESRTFNPEKCLICEIL